MALTPAAPSLTTFKLLSFDIFGTLVDDQAGINAALTPLISQLDGSHPAKHSKKVRVEAFDRIEFEIHKDQPSLPQDQVLARIYVTMGDEWGVSVPKEDAEKFAASMGSWPAFPDTIGALQTLSKYYKLVPLSNVDKATCAKVLSGPLGGVSFDAVHVAEEIGSYKPDHRNFNYLFDQNLASFGISKEQTLHVAHGLQSDHGPAKEMGFFSAWIARGTLEEEEKEHAGRVTYQWRWKTMGDMAQDVEKEFRQPGKSA